MTDVAMGDLSPENNDWSYDQFASLLEDDQFPKIPPWLVLLDIFSTLSHITYAQQLDGRLVYLEYNDVTEGACIIGTFVKSATR